MKQKIYCEVLYKNWKIIFNGITKRVKLYSDYKFDKQF